MNTNLFLYFRISYLKKFNFFVRLHNFKTLDSFVQPRFLLELPDFDAKKGQTFDENPFTGVNCVQPRRQLTR